MLSYHGGKPMKLRRIKICGDWIEITPDTNPGDNGEGVWHRDSMRVHPNLKGAALKRIIFHEAVHIAATSHGVNFSDRQADIVADLIHSILRDNPNLQTKWYGREK